ncbi:MAG TPA: response regulator transcription factor [Candidatus Sulfotelmatobacter sp.]|jgi:DNA-binding NarL/FixJ family response regulator|nr:response regulator transcription factor [Candidatus Sulfotelmatobacter sp.]
MICEATEAVPLEKMGRAVGGHALPTILLADDHEEMRRTVASVLQDEFQIVAMAENGAQAIEMALSGHPDVIVLDIFMPVVNGIETAIRVKAVGCPSKVLFLTVDEDPDLARAAMSSGALGYVLKGCLATDLIPAIRNAIEGRVYISRSMQSSMQSDSI